MNREEMIKFIKKERGYKNLRTQYGLLPIEECRDQRLNRVCEGIIASNKLKNHEATLKKERVAQVGIEKQLQFKF